MKIAVNADLKIIFELTLIEMLAAFVAPHEDIFGAHDAILVAYRLDLAFLFTKPGHSETEFRNQNSEVSIKNKVQLRLRKGSTKAAVTEPGAVATGSR